MGIKDLFGRKDRPQRKLMKMSLDELRSARVDTDFQLKEIHAQIERNRRQFDALIERGRSTANANEQKALAREADSLHRSVQLLQRDFDGLNDALKEIDGLLDIRKGHGTSTSTVSKRIEKLENLTPGERRRALDNLRNEAETSRAHLARRSEDLDTYAAEGESLPDSSPALALMRQPSLGSPEPVTRRQETTTTKEE